MSKFLSYIRDDKGGAVEYVLLIAFLAGLMVALINSTALRGSFTGLFSSLISNASNKSTF